MSERILDLNAVIPDDILVELGENEDGSAKRYAFPGDAPMEDLLRLMVKAKAVDEFRGSAEEALELREDLSADVEDLFRLRNPDLEDGEIHLTDTQLGELLMGLMRIYSEALQEAAAEALEDAGDEGGTRPTSTRRSSKNGKPSRASSGRRRKAKAASASSTSSQT